jgi:phospholipid-translocating ATPase
MIKIMEKLEEDMDLIGITGVEDRLQDEVAVTIEALRMAGIKVWMLTGDKVETAKCIAISAGLKSTNQSIFEIRGDDQIVKKFRYLDSARQTSVIFA